MDTELAPYTSEGTRRGEPEARYAVIGAVFGLLLIALGWRIPFRLAAWPLIGVGGLLVVVMSAYLATLIWKSASTSLVPLLKAARGHVHRDPQLGTLVRNPGLHCWETTLVAGDVTVDVMIQGDVEPSPVLLDTARIVLADVAGLDRRLQEYVAQQARVEATTDLELATEVAALRMREISWLSPAEPGRAVIDFAGPEEGRFWYCEYVNGELGPLDFGN